MTCIVQWANYETTPTVALAFDVSFAELNDQLGHMTPKMVTNATRAR
jgi:hypothetical protein